MSNKLLLCLLAILIAQLLGNGTYCQVVDSRRENMEQFAKRDHESSRDAGVVSWDSPRAREVERKFSSMDLSKVDPEDRLEEQMLALEGMLRREFSQDELHRLAASFVTLPVDPKKWSDFQSKLVCATIDCFLDSGDRGGLTVLLAVRCPRRAIRLDIEDRLAVSARTFKDPITVLGEAYAKSKIPETRQAIAEAARRAFTGSGIRGKDDGEFIENAMRWYRANKRRLEVNWHYGERSTSHNGEDYDTNPLFVPRAENSARKPSV